MTTITWYEEQNAISIEIKGHAGHAVKGEDIVCSAVSMLGQTLLAYLNIDNDVFDYSMRDGYIWCYAKGKNVNTAFHVIMAGYHLLEEGYPECVRLVRGCCMQRTP